MDFSPINKCTNPLRIQRGGEVIFVPCGHCIHCKQSNQSRWRQRLKHHLESPTFSKHLFITLTYENSHLPSIELGPNNTIISVTHTKFKSGNSNDYYRVNILDSFKERDFQFNDSIPTDSFIPHYVTKYDSSKNKAIYDTTQTFAICLRKDIQDFLKRLRSILSRHFLTRNRDTSFTYFICSEYGPKTFRPHYHGILSFRDSFVASLCNSSFINQAWSKSNLGANELAKQSQYITVGDATASYVSKYVSCDTDLPPVLRLPFTKPFFSSSKSVPIGSEILDVSDISHIVRETNLLYPYTYKDKDSNELITMQLPYPPSLWRTYFPQFLFHGRLDVSILSQLYTRIFDLNPYAKIPNYTKRFNNLFHIGVKDTNNSRLSNYNISDYEYNTYSHILPELLKHHQFIDLFLFGIPQNRTVVNKINKLRIKLLNTNDNWCSTADDYLYHLNLYLTKTFSNSLKYQYENYYNNYKTTYFTPITFAEYFPTFHDSLPKILSTLDPQVYESLASYLFNEFKLILEDFYDNSLNKIDFDIFNKKQYRFFNQQAKNNQQQFNTKRLHYQTKHLNY